MGIAIRKIIRLFSNKDLDCLTLAAKGNKATMGSTNFNDKDVIIFKGKYCILLTARFPTMYQPESMHYILW